jgi:signal peptidase II
MAEHSYRWLLWTVVLLGTGIDQVSKYGVFRWLHQDGEVCCKCEIVPGWFQLLAQFDKPESGEQFFTPLRTWSADVLPKVNQGALFGLGNQYAALANMVFAVVSVLAAVAIAYWSTRPSTGRDPFLCLALGLILAGTLGNLYDRVVFQGVRDFLYFHKIEWPVFNFADCCLVCGAFLLLGQAFLTGRSAEGARIVRKSEEMSYSTATVEAD